VTRDAAWIEREYGRDVGAEFTEAGRRAADRVARLERALRFQSVLFDYDAPDLRSIAGHRRPVFFPGHSADMAPWLAPAVFDAIRGVAGRGTCPAVAVWRAGE